MDNLFDPGYDYYSDTDLLSQDYEYEDEEPGEQPHITNTPSGTAERQMANEASQRGPPGTQNSQQKRKRRNRERYRPYGNATVSSSTVEYRGTLLPEICGHPIFGLAKIFHNSFNWMCTFFMGINKNKKLPNF